MRRYKSPRDYAYRENLSENSTNSIFSQHGKHLALLSVTLVLAGTAFAAFKLTSSQSTLGHETATTNISLNNSEYEPTDTKVRSQYTLSFGENDNQRLTERQTLPLQQQQAAVLITNDTINSALSNNDIATVANYGFVGPIPQDSYKNNNWQSLTISYGDSLSSIFSRIGLNQQTLLDIIAQDETKNLMRLYPGQQFQYAADNNGVINEIRLRLSDLNDLQIILGDDIATGIISRPVEQQLKRATAIISDSLFLSGKRAGLSDKIIMELANIFAWDIDFALDIRPGDTFNLIQEENWYDGVKLNDGAILAAEFTSRGKTYRAFRYQLPGGTYEYFSEDGLSMRKAFLRTPVNFTRISSRFSHGRKHPILHTIRAHRGVDYAAPTGTPIKAAGDGKIVMREKQRGYGNVIKIQHGSRYHTLYAHMNAFAKDFRVGSQVQQGQVIGYVGATGLATGPHLHYEFHIDDVHRDPLNIDLPEAAPIADNLLANYTKSITPFIAALAADDNTWLAQLNTIPN